jgi:hypothetical protein
MFIQSFPELLYEPVKKELGQVLVLMRRGEFSLAKSKLDLLSSAEQDLPIDVKMQILYEQACIHSLEARIRSSAEAEQPLDRAKDYLIRWFKLGRQGAWDAMGRTANAEVSRMEEDKDLQLLLASRIEEGHTEQVLVDLYTAKFKLRVHGLRSLR